MRIVLEEALDLPGRQDPVQAGGEGLRRHVGKRNVAADSGGQCRGDLRVSDGRWTSQGVCGALMAGFGERDGGHSRDVAHVHGADRGVADRGVKAAFG